MTDSGGQESGTRPRDADRPSFWFTSATPLLLAFVGLLGTGVGAVLQGYWNTKLEREKFEFTLIQKALENADKTEAGRNLMFLLQAGLLSQFDGKKIEALASKPEQLPSFFGQMGSLIPIRRAKSMLASLGMYKGPINDEADQALINATRDFQKSQNLLPDGVMGLMTLRALEEAVSKSSEPSGK